MTKTLNADQARTLGYTFTWEDDWLVGSHKEEYGPDSAYEDHEPDTCEECIVRDPDGNVAASLSCIDDATDDYRREIENDLASELRLPDTYATDRIDRVRRAFARPATLKLTVTARDGQTVERSPEMDITDAELADIRSILARRTVSS